MIVFFSVKSPPPPEIYTSSHPLSLHDALPFFSRRFARGIALTPSPHDGAPALGNRRQHRAARAQILATLVVVRGSRQHGLRITPRTLAAMAMEGIDADREVRGIGADFVA